MGGPRDRASPESDLRQVENQRAPHQEKARAAPLLPSRPRRGLDASVLGVSRSATRAPRSSPTSRPRSTCDLTSRPRSHHWCRQPRHREDWPRRIRGRWGPHSQEKLIQVELSSRPRSYSTGVTPCRLRVGSSLGAASEGIDYTYGFENVLPYVSSDTDMSYHE
jgi:hypothetical protein